MPGDVARDCQQALGPTVSPPDRRDLHIPPLRRTLEGFGGPLEMPRTPRQGRPERRLGVRLRLSLPEPGPVAALDLAEVVGLHHGEAALVHEGQPGVGVEHLDAVGRGGKNAAHERGIRLLLGGSVPLGRTIPQDLQETLVPAAFVHQRHHLAVGPEQGPVPAQVPALVGAAPVQKGRTHLLLGDALGHVLLGEEHPRRPASHFGLGPAEDPFSPRGPARHEALQVHGDDGVVDGAFQDGLVTPVLLPSQAHGASQLQGRHDLVRERAQHEGLRRRQLVRLGVEDTQRTESDAIGGPERGARVEPNLGPTHDERIFRGPRVACQILDLEHVILSDREGTDRLGQGRLALVEAEFGLEPLALAIEERDQRDGHAADLGRHLHEIVELGLGGRVEDVVAGQRGMPARLDPNASVDHAPCRPFSSHRPHSDAATGTGCPDDFRIRFDSSSRGD